MGTFARSASICCAGLLLALSTGCATILGGGGHQPVTFSSASAGRHVDIVNNKGTVVHSGVTPFTVTLDRGRGYFAPANYTVRVTDSTPARESNLKGGLNAWYLGNLIFGGLIGIVVVDPLTGAMWDLPKEFNVDGVSPHADTGPIKSPPAATSRGPAVAQSTGQRQ